MGVVLAAELLQSGMAMGLGDRGLSAADLTGPEFWNHDNSGPQLEGTNESFHGPLTPVGTPRT